MIKLIKFFINIFIGTFAVIGVLLLIHGFKAVVRGKVEYVDLGIYITISNIYFLENNF